MKWSISLLLMFLLCSFSSVTSGQEYWEYDQWDNEWERHDPVAGLKYEYENGVEVEEQAYEWEPGEGYHEEEWYDPSDWFDDDDSVDYEDDYNWGYGTGYNFDGYDYDHYNDYTSDFYEDDVYRDRYTDNYYDNYDYDYDYFNGVNGNTRDEVDYTFDQELSGEVLGFKRITGTYGQPQSVAVRLRTDDGQIRELQLGDRAYADRFLPQFSKGDRVAIGGERVTVDGENMFRAKELRSGAASYRIPYYEYEQRIEGKIVGLRQARMNNGELGAVIARVQPEEGQIMDVLLGTEESMRQQATSIRPGSQIQVDGYSREVDGSRTFVVQEVKVNSSNGKQTEPGENQQADQQAEMPQRSQRR